MFFFFFTVECLTFETEAKYAYRFPLSRLQYNNNGVLRLKFSVKSDKDVYVALSSRNAEADDMYEIMIGGSRNTKCVRS